MSTLNITVSSADHRRFDELLWQWGHGAPAGAETVAFHYALPPGADVAVDGVVICRAVPYDFLSVLDSQGIPYTVVD